MFVTIILFTLFAICKSTPRNFYHLEMCKGSGSTDCSFQMDDQKNAFCTVYNTQECRNFDFSNWMKQSPKHPTVQSDSIYSIDASPYVSADSGGGDAVNITFTTSDKDINGYVLLLENSAVPVNICRIFDFRNSSTNGYVTLFYDCFIILTQHGAQNFEIKVKALPHNEEMVYSLFLPLARNIEPANACHWKPLMMIFKGGLENNMVEGKFSQAPEHLSVSSYEVSLFSNQSGEMVQTVTLEATQAALADVMFSHVDRGLYSICVRPLTNISSTVCGIVQCSVFSIENKLLDKIIISYIITVCLIGFGVAIAIQLFLRWLTKAGPIKSNARVFLVYSYDCKEHNDVVLSYIQYLKKQCHMEVLTIYGEQTSNVDLWLRSPYRNCDVVMIIISDGIFYENENCNSPASTEGYSCRNRLIQTLSFLEINALSDKKNFIAVYFEYSRACCVPPFMECGQWGKAFMIPREVNYMLCKAHKQNPKIECLAVYPRMPGHDVVSLPEGMALIESTEEMKKVLSENRYRASVVPNECIDKNCEKSCERHTSYIDNKDKPKNFIHEESRYFPKSRQSTNFPTNEEKGCSDSDFRLNSPSKQWHLNHTYVPEHLCDEENCAHLSLLQGSELCAAAKHKSNHGLNEQNIQRNNISHKTDEISPNRKIEDLQYILSKPGPSFSLPL